MKTDSYGEIINDEETYRGIASCLLAGSPVLIGWTDEASSHLDILFTIKPAKYGGQIQGGIRPNDLFVSIMRIGAFAFEIPSGETFASYYAEKLDGNGYFRGGKTFQKVADLINGVKRHLL